MVVQVVEITGEDNTRTAKSSVINWSAFLLKLMCVPAAEPTLPDS